MMSILQMSFYGAVLISIICVIRMFLLNKLPKKTFIILWAIVMLRLLVPFNLPSQFSIYSVVDTLEYSSNEFWENEELIPQTPSNMDLSSEINKIITDNSLNATNDISLSATNDNILSDTNDNNLNATQDSDKEPINIYVTIWLVGTFGFSLFFCFAYLKCRREFNMSLPIDNTYISQWENSHKLIRTYEIRQSSKINTPLTYGILKPIILLPKKTHWSNEDNINYVLTHEYVHIKQFDSLMKLVLTVTLCVHWFNPLVWAMYILANKDIELCCDQKVVRSLGGKSKYANMLINMAQEQTFLTPLCNNFSKNSVEERVKAIVKIKKSSIVMVVSAFLLVAMITIIFVTSAKANVIIDATTIPDNTLEASNPLKASKTTYKNDNISTNVPEEIELEGEKIFNKDNIDKINIDSLSGDIKIVNHDSDDDEISINYSDNNIKVKCFYYIENDALYIKTYNEDNMLRNFKGNLEVNIPKSISPDIFIEAISSNITVEAILKEVEIDAISGDIFLNNNITDIEVESTSGDIYIISDQHKTKTINADGVSGDFILVGEELNYTLEFDSLEEKSIKTDNNDSKNQEMAITFDSVTGDLREKSEAEIYYEPNMLELDTETMIEDNINKINVEFISGDIIIANSENDKLSIDYSGNNSDVECYYYIEDDELFIETYYEENSRNNPQEDNLYINIPKSMSPSFDVETISSDVTVEAILEEVDIESVSGDIILKDNITDIKVDNVSGDVYLISDQHKTRTMSVDSVSGSFILDGNDFNYNLNFDSLSEEYSTSENNSSSNYEMKITFQTLNGDFSTKS